MDASFGIKTRPTTLHWEVLRKGPPRQAVLEHLDRIIRYRYDMQNG